MEWEAFDRTLRQFIRRVPFKPFSVELNSGSRFSVHHPEALAFNHGVAVYIDVAGIPQIFDHTSVTQLIRSVDSQSTEAA
ncbi:MAG: hypothetical protein M3Y86_06525 [Verrucomicrobiota bacterium]|nr:hypothetical protein [Verrucomicrobiota bacterium]